MIFKVDTEEIHETSNLSDEIEVSMPTTEVLTNTMNATEIDETMTTSMIHVDSKETVDDTRTGERGGIETLITIVIEVVSAIEDAIEIEDASEIVIGNAIAK